MAYPCLDWSRVVATAREARMPGSAFYALDASRRLLGAGIPDSVLEALSADLKLRLGQAALSDDRRECSPLQFPVIRHWHRGRRALGPSLHDDVTAALANLAEAMATQDPANIPA